MVAWRPSLIEATLSCLDERGCAHFVSQLQLFRADGLPDNQVLGEPNGLTFLGADFDLPIKID